MLLQEPVNNFRMQTYSIEVYILNDNFNKI